MVDRVASGCSSSHEARASGAATPRPGPICVHSPAAIRLGSGFRGLRKSRAGPPPKAKPPYNATLPGYEPSAPVQRSKPCDSSDYPSYCWVIYLRHSSRRATRPAVLHVHDLSGALKLAAICGVRYSNCGFIGGAQEKWRRLVKPVIPLCRSTCISLAD